MASLTYVDGPVSFKPLNGHFQITFPSGDDTPAVIVSRNTLLVMLEKGRRAFVDEMKDEVARVTNVVAFPTKAKRKARVKAKAAG